MENNVNSLENGPKMKPLKELKNAGRFREAPDASSGVDSGIGSLSYSDSMSDRSSTESYFTDGPSRDEECEKLTNKTKILSINDKGNVRPVGSASAQSNSTDEGYKSLSSEKQSTSNAHNYLAYFSYTLSESLRYSAQTGNIRYIFSSCWPLLLRQNEDGDTSLHLAIINGNEQLTLAMLDVLPKLPQYLDIYNNLTQTPLHLAVITRQPKIVQKLIDYGASVDVVDRNGQTCVHLACQRGDLNTIRAIFKPIPSKVDLNEKLQEVLETRNFDGLTPLLVAVKGKYVEVVKELLILGADVNTIDSKNGNSALHMAVEDNNLPMVSLLLFKGNANPNAMSYSDCTPLHIAVGLDLKTITATLIAVGASSSIENFEGDTAFRSYQDGDFLDNDYSDDDPGIEEMVD